LTNKIQRIFESLGFETFSIPSYLCCVLIMLLVDMLAVSVAFSLMYESTLRRELVSRLQTLSFDFLPGQ